MAPREQHGISHDNGETSETTQEESKLVRRRPRRWLSLAGAKSLGAYPWGVFVVILSSRYAPWIARALTLATLAYAAAPDFGFDRLKGWRFFAVLVVLYLLARSAETLVHGTELDSYRRTFKEIAGLISSLAGVQRGGTPEIIRDPNRSIEALLRRARELAESSIKLPAGQRMTANLLLPVQDEVTDEIAGLKATMQDDYLPDRTHEVIPLDAPGAPEAFLTGKAIAVPCTDNETHPRIQGKNYKSIALFPICVGEPAGDGVIVAVLSIDSTKPYTFEDGDVKQIAPFIMPIAQLVGLALELRKEARP